MRTPPFRVMSRRAVRVALLVIAFAGFGGPRMSAAEEDGFTRGNRAYASGKFDEAATAYEAQARRGDYSANLFYNLGDAYYRSGSRGRAILNYRRALLLEPSHAEAAANLAFAGGAPLVAATRGINANADLVCWLTAGGFWLALAGWLVWRLSVRWRGLGVLLLTAGMAGGAAGGVLIWRNEAPNRQGAAAVVIVADAPAHYSPADNSKVVTKLSEGTEVRVLSEQGAWVYTSLDDGARAWVSSDKIERLIPVR